MRCCCAVCCWASIKMHTLLWVWHQQNKVPEHMLGWYRLKITTAVTDILHQCGTMKLLLVEHTCAGTLHGLTAMTVPLSHCDILSLRETNGREKEFRERPLAKGGK